MPFSMISVIDPSENYYYVIRRCPRSEEVCGKMIYRQYRLGCRMGDVADLTAKAYEIVRMIPPGHVTTYGQSILIPSSSN